jgi:hypothetical protein
MNKNGSRHNTESVERFINVVWLDCHAFSSSSS